ncbi:hypothetical protein BDN72DRAFT_846948 [Pluteus cervinus]|uniref:Uncharacterized protein n=1 Tax=Pluteus cervinus TaxID=181527 RepID=A0ACD3AGS7_9AGAR|nr:hypothetical protein BDN72DRAFT_846948 [Pluteus cervinus]
MEHQIPDIEIDERAYEPLREYISMPVLRAMWKVFHTVERGPAFWMIITLATSSLLSKSLHDKTALEGKLWEYRYRQPSSDNTSSFSPGMGSSETWSSASPQIIEIKPRHQFNATQRAAIEEFTQQPFREEKDMYEPFAKLLRPIVRTQHESITVMDTHTRSYLSGQRPTITLQDATYENPHAACVWQLVELTGPSSFLDGEKIRGQCLKYLYKLRRKQSSRSKFSILLSNQTSCHWLFANYPQSRFDLEEPKIQISSKLSQVDGLAHLVDLLKDYNYAPVLPRFILLDGKINDVLGINRTCVVVSSTFSGSKVAEIAVLGKVKGNVNFPQLCSFTPDFLEFAFTPVGESLCASKINKMPRWLLSIVHGIRDGLSFLPGQGFVHRDIRWENIIIDNEHRPVIIDFNAATAANEPVPFSGGYICCPPEIFELGDPVMLYDPIPAHDWKAYILLLHSALFPALYTNLSGRWVFDWTSQESKALRQLWVNLRTSTIWNRALEAAEHADVEELRVWVCDLLTTFPDPNQRMQLLFAELEV